MMMRRFIDRFVHRRTTGLSQAEWQFRKDASEWNRRFAGPREECDSPYDPRWPLNEHDRQTLLIRERSRQAWLAYQRGEKP